jgi:hypothetical protein
MVSYLAENKSELLAIRMPLSLQGDEMIIFFLTYAVLAVLGLSLVGSTSAQVPKPSAKAGFQTYVLKIESSPCSLI